MRHLVLCAHGTDNASGRAIVREIREAVSAELPDIAVHDAYVDVQEPSVGDLLHRLRTDPVELVPLLLCTGYHVQVDVAKAVKAHGRARAARALGPDQDLTELLTLRLREAGATPGEPVILAAAGSSRSQATQDAYAAAALLEASWGGPVTAAFGSAAQPRVRDEVARESSTGDRAVVASYLLGHGYFHDLLQSTGADVVTDPLGCHPLVVKAVRNRWSELTGM